jgi:hypothetical protein
MQLANHSSGQIGSTSVLVGFGATSRLQTVNKRATTDFIKHHSLVFFFARVYVHSITGIGQTHYLIVHCLVV